MKELVYKNEEGQIMHINYLGNFRIEELDKEYIMYSFNDENPNEPNGKVLLGEIIRNDEDITVLGIEEEEIPLVMAFYNEISNQLGGTQDE